MSLLTVASPEPRPDRPALGLGGPGDRRAGAHLSAATAGYDPQVGKAGVIEIAEISIGREGVAYIRECLSAGKRLSQCVLETADLDQGALTTFLPLGVPARSVADFWRGGKMGEDTVVTVRDGQTKRVGHVHTTRSQFLSLIDDQSDQTHQPFVFLRTSWDVWVTTSCQ